MSFTFNTKLKAEDNRGREPAKLNDESVHFSGSILFSKNNKVRKEINLHVFGSKL